MKKLILGLALLNSVSTFAGSRIKIEPGSSVTISPSKEITIISCASAFIAKDLKCTLEWDSTWGEEMPDLIGMGFNRKEAISSIKKQCKSQKGEGNAMKCFNIASTATCVDFVR